jgi:hypothetical protein
MDTNSYYSPINLMFANSNIPYPDNSLPKSLFFIPSNETLGSETTALITVTTSDFIIPIYLLSRD